MANDDNEGDVAAGHQCYCSTNNTMCHSYAYSYTVDCIVHKGVVVDRE